MTHNVYFVLHFCVGTLDWFRTLTFRTRAFQVGGWETGKLPVQVHPTTFAYSRRLDVSDTDLTNTDMLHLDISDLHISPRCFTTGRFTAGNVQDRNVQVRSNRICNV